MRRASKVLVWVVIFATSAGIGAYIAAHSNPFPPGVGSVVEPTHGTSPSPIFKLARWKVVFTSSSSHDRYVGGSCATAWAGSFVFQVDDRGRVSGAGTAKLDGHLVCAAPTAQIQLTSISFSVKGERTSDGFTLHLTESASSPAGGDDQGGFRHTVLESGKRFDLVFDGDGGRLHFQRVDDQGRGAYRSILRVTLECVRGCGLP